MTMSSEEPVSPERTLKIYFAGAGMDGEARYELHGLTADIAILTFPQLYEELKNAGVSEHAINQLHDQIGNLSTATMTYGQRPAAFLHY